MSTRSTLSGEDAQDAAIAARVGSTIAELRRARGLTQAKLAEMINLEQEAISRWNGVPGFQRYTASSNSAMRWNARWMIYCGAAHGISMTRLLWCQMP